MIVSFVTGGMFVAFMVALFSAEKKEDNSAELIEEEAVPNFSNRLYELSCQSCRKLKNHREVEFKVYECCGCRRRTNLAS